MSDIHKEVESSYAFCADSACVNYYEDSCILCFSKANKGYILPKDINTWWRKSERCPQYKKGKCDWYNEEEQE